MTFLNGLSRFFICPAVVWVADALMPGLVNYANFWQILAVGWVLAGFSVFADLTLLPAIETYIGAAALDAAAAAAILYFSQFFMMRASLSWWGAIITAVLLGLTELGTHAWIAVNNARRLAP